MTQFERDEVSGCCYHCGNRNRAAIRQIWGLGFCEDCWMDEEITTDEQPPFVPIPTQEWGK